MRQFFQYLTTLGQLFRKQSDNIRWLVTGPYADRLAAVFRQINQTRRDDSFAQPYRGQHLKCVPTTIELIDRIVTEYLGAEKISGADYSFSRALERPPSQNSKASGRRVTVRRA
jgi:hypothetical protein